MNAAVRNMTEPMMTTIAGSLFIGNAPLSYRRAVLLADPQIPGEGKTGESQANKIWASYDGFVTNHFSAGRVPLCTSRACRDRLHRRWLPWRYPFRRRGRWIGEKTQQEPGHAGHEGDTQPHVDLPPQAGRGENGEVIA